jgi:hypothetical protein
VREIARINPQLNQEITLYYEDRKHPYIDTECEIILINHNNRTGCSIQIDQKNFEFLINQYQEWKKNQ